VTGRTAHRQIYGYGSCNIGVAQKDVFEVIVFADDVTRHKPCPDKYILAAERLGLELRECTVCEDSQPGVESAVAADMRCVADPKSHTCDHDCSREDIVLDGLLPLSAFLLDEACWP